MKRDTYRVALGGLVIALAVAVMFLGSIFPFTTVAVPAIASLTVLYFAIEYKKLAATFVYIAISILSLLFIPEKEAALLFVFFFGHYPILKSIFEMMRSKLFGWILKFAVFDSAIILLYWLITKILVIEAVRQEFAGYSTTWLAALLLLGNITFLVYDIALTRLISLYIYRFRPMLTRKFRRHG